MCDIQSSEERRRAGDIKMAGLNGFLQDMLAKVTHLPADNYLSLELCKQLFICIGLWPADSEPKRITAVVRSCLPPFLLFMNVYTGILGYPMLVYLTYGVDLQRCLLAAASEIAVFVLSVIYWSLLCRRQQIDRMFRAMEAMNVCSAKLAERPSYVVEGSNRWAKVPLGYMLLCLAMIPLSFLDLPGVYAKRDFLYDQWYPFDEKVFPAYQIVFFFTTICHNCSLVAMVSFTAMFMSLIVEASGHFRLLSHNFRNIVAAGQVVTVKSSDCSNPPQDGEQPIAKPLLEVGGAPDHQPLDEAKQDDAQLESIPYQNPETTDELPVQDETCILCESPVNQPKEEIKESIKSCVEHHTAIIRFVEEVAKLFDRFLFEYLMCTLIPTSIVVVLVIYAKELDERTKSVLVLVMGSNLGMAVMYWLADHMTEESEGVRDAVYDCDWFGQSESFKRSLRIIMSQCNQPVVVKFGGFVALSMETYYSMSKLTYSYCMAVWTQYQEAAKR